MSLNVISSYAANVAHRFLAKSDSEATRSLAKLSSGTRVLNGSDDAAALALGTQIRNDVVSFKQAAVNVGQATSMLQIADGGMSTVSDILIRMKSLAMQAASDQVGAPQRSMIQTEFTALQEEVTRIANTTKFAGKGLIDGSLVTDGLLFQVGGGNDNGNDSITVKIADMRASALGSDGQQLGQDPIEEAAGSKAVIALDVGTVNAPDNGSNVTQLGNDPDTVQEGQQAVASVSAVKGIVISDAADFAADAFEMSVEVNGTAIKYSEVVAAGAGPTAVDLSASKSIEDIATAIETALGTVEEWKDADGNQTVHAYAEDGILFITDTLGRALADIALTVDAGTDLIDPAAGTAEVVAAGQELTNTVVQITGLDAATLPDTPAALFKMNVGNDISVEVDLTGAAELSDIATAIQTALQAAADAAIAGLDDGGALTVDANHGVLSIVDTKGRAFSGIELISGQSGIEANSTDSVQTITGLSTDFAAGYVGKLTIAVGDVTVEVDLATKETGTEVATEVESQLSSGIDSSITASFSDGTLTIKDSQGRVFSNASLVDNTGEDAVTSVTKVTGIDEALAAGDAFALDITIGETEVDRIDLSEVAAGSLATTIQSALQEAVDDDVTATFDDGILTINDAQGRGISAVNLISSQDNKIADLEVGTQVDASDALSVINDAIDDVANARADVGALQNRLDYAAQNLATQSENMEAARSNLMDLDMAAEMSNFTSKQILQQAGISMLAQAQRMPQNLLRLFQ